MGYPSQNQDPANTIPSPQPHPQRPPGRGKWLTLATIMVVVGTGSLFVILRGASISAENATIATISITPQGFEPQTIKVRQGDSVAWENMDIQARQVEVNPISSSASTDHSGQLLAAGDSYTTTFETPGIYSYHDRYNPDTFKATVIVE